LTKCAFTPIILWFVCAREYQEGTLELR